MPQILKCYFYHNSRIVKKIYFLSMLERVSIKNAQLAATIPHRYGYPSQAV